MSEPTPVLPVETAHTPGRAALRALGWGLLIDVSVALVLALSAAFGDIRWTATYWLALAGTLAKTTLQSAVAYLVRRFVNPYLVNHGQ